MIYSERMIRLVVVAACLAACSSSNCPDVTPTIKFASLTPDQITTILSGTTGTCDGGCSQNQQDGQDCMFMGVLHLSQGVATTSGTSSTSLGNGVQCTKHVVYGGVDTLTVDINSTGGTSGAGAYTISDGGSGSFVGSCP